MTMIIVLSMAYNTFKMRIILSMHLFLGLICRPAKAVIVTGLCVFRRSGRYHRVHTGHSCVLLLFSAVLVSLFIHEMAHSLI